MVLLVCFETVAWGFGVSCGNGGVGNPSLSPWRYVRQRFTASNTHTHTQSVYKRTRGVGQVYVEALAPYSISVILTTNLIASSPSTALLKYCIQSLEYLDVPAAPLVVAVDGSSEITRLNVYVANVQQLCAALIRPCSVIVAPQTVGLIVNIDQAIRHVTSDYVLIMQHDLPFIQHAPLPSILAAMERNRYTADVRHFIRRVCFKWHGGLEGGNDTCYGKGNIEEGGHIFVRTPVWSDRNHIALRSYYTSGEWHALVRNATAFFDRNASRSRNFYMFPETYFSIKSSLDCYTSGNFVYGIKGTSDPYLGSTNGRETPWLCAAAFDFVTAQVDLVLSLWE